MKKFFEKLKNLFKNKLFARIFASVLGVATLGTGIGFLIYNEVCGGGSFNSLLK